MHYVLRNLDHSEEHILEGDTEMSRVWTMAKLLSHRTGERIFVLRVESDHILGSVLCGGKSKT
jgi:hypothetical protein